MSEVIEDKIAYLTVFADDEINNNVEDERIRQEWFNATSNLADTLRSQLVLVENNELYYT